MSHSPEQKRKKEEAREMAEHHNKNASVDMMRASKNLEHEAQEMINDVRERD